MKTIYVGITAAWVSYGSYRYSTDPLRILHGSFDPLAETRSSAGRQQYYWNKDI
jgi:hypothetical protein